MKTIIKFLFIVCVYFSFLNPSIILSQEHECGTPESTEMLSVGTIGGLYKPHRTDISDGLPADPDASFNILIVFCQFPDETRELGEWPIGQPPVYMNNLLAFTKNSAGNFWDRYNYETQILSDYYQELSRGLFHVTGVTKNYIYDKPRSHYNNNSTLMNDEIYEKLQEDFSFNFSAFDKWKKISDGNYKYERDGNVDMLIIVRRDMVGDAGFAGLDGESRLVDPVNNIWIRTGFSSIGSGAVVQGNGSGLLEFNRFFGILIHEVGHFLWGNHTPTGVMTSRGGISINDLFGSPFEKIQLGYLAPTIVNYSNINYTIGDISNRTSTNQILKVPISSEEYFIVTNRRKISKFDIAMLGDTTRLDIRRNTGEIGKGVYIYHGKDGTNYPGNQDIECADGLWNWDFGQSTAPDWDVALYPNLIRQTISVTINNDINPRYDAYGNYLNHADDQSARKIQSGTWGPWFSWGKRHTQIGEIGTDKIYTNHYDWWTSRALYGDRWDAWNLGYNEIFSPYSNPNTKNWSNNNTGIFIQYTGLNGNDASFKIYKTGEGGYTEEQILQITPPSKPQILEIQSYWNGRTCNPKIVWRQNSEPDMINSDQNPEIIWKRYKVYKSGNLNGMDSLPPDQMFYPEQKYQLVATIDVNPNTTDAYWIDPNVNLYDCSQTGEVPGTPYPVRYRVQAVDKYSTSSVLSDFRSAVGVKNGSGEPIGDPEENPILNTGTNQTVIPDKYILKQNYPNPFNPTTNIEFELPVGNFVVLKVYDINGREIKTLINEFKPAGRYLFSFNASDLSSGIYIYKIISGNFNETKRMVLIK